MKEFGDEKRNLKDQIEQHNKAINSLTKEKPKITILEQKLESEKIETQEKLAEIERLK